MSPPLPPTQLGRRRRQQPHYDEDDDYDYENEYERRDLLTRYNDMLDRRPVLTKALTAAIVQGIGAALGSAMSSPLPLSPSERKGGGIVAMESDVSRAARRRRMEASSSPLSLLGRIDWLDVLAFALHGLLLNGPVGHYWFEFLERHGPESKSKSMLLDQLVVQPPLLVLMMVFMDSIKAAIKEIPPSLRRTLSTVGPSIVSSWRVWPVAVYCTFRYLKKKHYTVALNLCSIAWTMYLCKTKKMKN